MIATYILAGAIIILAISIVMRGVIVVPQSETRVIERLGRFHSVLSPGLNFIIPFIDRPKTIYTRRVENVGGRHVVRTTSTSVIDLREQVYDFPSQQVINSDNVTTDIYALLYFQITESLSLTRPLLRVTPSIVVCRTYSMTPLINGA